GFLMVRTQVYLTKEERDELAILAETTGKRQSQLIREAVDQLIGRSSSARRQAVLNRAAGLWKNRKDLPDFRAKRSEWDRG
ncbi:MAG: ribbon-helix-helix domain-containing protein, partial [Phycisphaeraceae bacterium]